MCMIGVLCTTGLTHPVETQDCRDFVLSERAADDVAQRAPAQCGYPAEICPVSPLDASTS